MKWYISRSVFNIDKLYKLHSLYTSQDGFKNNSKKKRGIMFLPHSLGMEKKLP